MTTEESFYSQYGEDKVFAKLLEARGRLLDVGAWHPKTFSNSRMLIERGWEATLCEFSPGPLRDLLIEYAGNPRVRVVQAAVSAGDHGLWLPFKVTDDGLSTNTPAIAEKWAERGGYYGEMWVPLLSLERILIQFGGFEFVSFDTEGTSVDLAVHFITVLGQRPQVMCVEHDDRTVQLMGVAQEAGYQMVHLNGTNAVIALV